MTTDRPEQRARSVALAGLVFEIILAAFFAVLMVWSRSEAMRALTLLAAAGSVVWLFLVLVYHQRVLVQEEAFETEQLRRERQAGGGTDAIFDVADEQLLLARRRLQWMYRWLLPAFTLAFIVLLLVSGLSYWSWGLGESLSSDAWGAVEHPGLLIWFVGGAAFLSFLFSRYATGMARQPEWRMLHAGAAYLMGVTLSAAGLAAALGALHFFQTPVPERVMAQVLRLLLLVLAGETGLNFVVDFYRPRAPGEEPRPAFDSRLLGLFTEPGGIARSIAEAINYQFGFEVSSTWFYKLLQRSVGPLLAFAGAALLAASSFVFVRAEQEAVVELFGEKCRELDPGFHLKWPWPIEIAYKVPTAQLQELKIGITAGPEKRDQQDELILWTTEHAQEPHLEVLVATPKLARFLEVGEPGEVGEAAPEPGPAATRPADRGPGEQAAAVPVSQLRVSVSLQYQIRDAYQWLRTYENPQAMLEAIAKREIIRSCASVDVGGLLGGQRGPIEQALGRAIQESADRRELGVDIVFVGLQGVHPPAETAEAFQDVIGAESKRTASVRSAWADRNKRLSEVAGNIGRAEQLSRAIRHLNELEADPDVGEPGRRSARERLQTLFFGDAERAIPPAGGLAAEMIMRARQKRWQLENAAHGQAAAFDAEIVASDAAPRVYTMRRYLEMLAEALPGIRKYVMAAEGQHAVRTFNLNLQDPRDIPLDVVLEKEE